MPSPLRPAPPRTTPLPATFTLAEDPGTRTFDGGTVLLGGSPLRLLRLSERARRLVDRWRDGAPVGPGRAAQQLARRLVSAGAFTPQPMPNESSMTPPTTSADAVTVVIPVRDRPAELDRLLGRIGNLPCIVVDDASADPGRIKEITESHGATYRGLTSNVGPARARNEGLDAATTPLIAFIDSDCIPDEGWLGPLLGHFDDPLVAAVAPRIITAQPDRLGAARSSLDRGERAGPVRPGSAIPFVPSAALVVRADLAEGTELFDPALRGGEDVDLVWRLVEAGWDVRYDPSSAVIHDGPSTLGAFLGRRAFYGTTAGPLSRRHGQALAPVHVAGWSLLVWGLLLARRPVLACTALAASIVLLARRLVGLVRDPVDVATRIVGGGTARAAVPALSSLTRAWGPAFVLGLLFRRTRRASALALLIPAVYDSATQRRTENPLPAVAVHVADDVAYGAGVWLGCARARTLVPLIPRVSWRARAWSAPSLRDELQTRSRQQPHPQQGATDTA